MSDIETIPGEYEEVDSGYNHDYNSFNDYLESYKDSSYSYVVANTDVDTHDLGEIPNGGTNQWAFKYYYTDEPTLAYALRQENDDPSSPYYSFFKERVEFRGDYGDSYWDDNIDTTDHYPSEDTDGSGFGVGIGIGFGPISASLSKSIQAIRESTKIVEQINMLSGIGLRTTGLILKKMQRELHLQWKVGKTTEQKKLI